MTDADKQTVMDTRKKDEAKGLTPTKRKVSEVKVSNVKAQLAIFFAAIKLGKASKDGDTSTTDDSNLPDNAGDSFGGRSKEKTRTE
jgi:hypothetical protein